MQQQLMWGQRGTFTRDRKNIRGQGVIPVLGKDRIKEISY
jgi:hypothetical protein